MIDQNDRQTRDMLAGKRPGRPATGKALSVSQRVAKHRRKKRDRRAWALLLNDPTELDLGELLEKISAESLRTSGTMPPDLFAIHLDELLARYKARFEEREENPAA